MKDLKELDSPDQIVRRGDTLDVALWYPPRAGDSENKHVRFIVIDLVDVRAADYMRVHYDFDRHGYAIEQPTKHEWDADDGVCDPCWKEVAFISAYHQEVKP